MPDNKNPTAVQIGQRIKQARKMAGFDSAAQLLDKIKVWGTGRLGNYEAGISIPSPDDIKTIAKFTGSSPCWIMFGLGPIRATGRDIQAIRHQNFVFLYENIKSERGKMSSFLKDISLSKKKVEDYLSNPFLTIQDRTARLCEKAMGKPRGWMDEQHVETDPLCAAFPEDMRYIMEVFSNLPEEKRALFIKLARVFDE